MMVADKRQVVAVVSFYVVVSIAMIVVNKSVLKKTSLPLLFLWSQLAFAAAVLKMCGSAQLTYIPTITLADSMRLFPLVAINVLGLAMNTMCLARMDAVLYQITRTLILPITVVGSIFFKQDGGGVSWRIVNACMLIFCGFIIGIFGGESSMTVPMDGIVFGILSSFTTAAHSFVIKSSLNAYKSQGPFDLVYLNNALSAVLLLPALLLEAGKWPAFLGNAKEIRAFLVGALVSGCTGLLINVASFLQIGVTSPLTHTVSSAARGVLQTLAAGVLLNEAITAARGIGVGITLAGSCLYSWIRAIDAHATESPPDKYSKV